LTAILVDTDILIEVLRERDASVLAEWRRLATDDQPILYSPVTATELCRGARKKEETTIRTLLSAMICVLIDEEIGRRAGEFLRTFRLSQGGRTGRRPDRGGRGLAWLYALDTQSKALPDERGWTVLRHRWFPA